VLGKNLYKFYRWDKLEEQLVTEALGQPPMVFKPILQLLTPTTINTNQPQAVINGTFPNQLKANYNLLSTFRTFDSSTRCEKSFANSSGFH